MRVLMDHVGEGPPLARLLAAADAQGRTALHACALPATRAAKMLVDAGADVDAVDGTGATPLHVAATGDSAIDDSKVCRSASFTSRDTRSWRARRRPSGGGPEDRRPSGQRRSIGRASERAVRRATRPGARNRAAGPWTAHQRGNVALIKALNGAWEDGAAT